MPSSEDLRPPPDSSPEAAALWQSGQPISVCGTSCRLLRLLGRGKGGYSFLAVCGSTPVVLKQIHHEPCDFYSFGDKLEAERRDYALLRRARIRVPDLLAVDPGAERILKTFIPGPTVFELIRDGLPAAPYLPQIREMAALAKAAGLNIDYFPTNFVVQDGTIWYVDYECNPYSDQWSFDSWGIRYWSRTPEFLATLPHVPAPRP